MEVVLLTIIVEGLAEFISEYFPMKCSEGSLAPLDNAIHSKWYII